MSIYTLNMKFPIDKLVYFFLFFSIFAPIIFFYTGMDLGSSLNFFLSLLFLMFILQKKVKIEKNLMFFLLSVTLLIIVQFFSHRINPFALTFLSLIYIIIFLSALLRKVSIYTLVRRVFFIYSIQVLYIILECILIFMHRVSILKTISGGGFREDYNQFTFYFKDLGIHVASGSLFFMPQASGMMLMFLFYLIFFSPCMQNKYKLIIQPVLLILFILFALNSTDILIVLLLFIFTYLLKFKVNYLTLKFKLKLGDILKIITFLCVIYLSFLGIKTLFLKTTYHTRLTEAQLQEKTRQIYFNSFKVFKQQRLLDQFVGVGVKRRSYLLDAGDCAFGNSLLAFGVLPIFVLGCFVFYFSKTMLQALILLNRVFFKRRIASNQFYVLRYMLISNYLLFLGWIVSTIHYAILFKAPGFMLASLSAVIVLLISRQLKREVGT